jgi:hypothetical protein
MDITLKYNGVSLDPLSIPSLPVFDPKLTLLMEICCLYIFLELESQNKENAYHYDRRQF